MSNLSKIEKLRETHRVVGLELDVGYDFTSCTLAKPDANIKVFWELINEVVAPNSDWAYQELIRAIELYNSTLVHIV